MPKSYVTLEQAQCPCCGQVFDTGSLLLDRRLKERFDHKTCTHYSLCKECDSKHANGYLALIAVTNTDHSSLHIHDAERTGQMVHIRREAFERIFGQPAPTVPIAFCEPEVIQKLQDMAKAAEDSNEQG